MLLCYGLTHLEQRQKVRDDTIARMTLGQTPKLLDTLPPEMPGEHIAKCLTPPAELLPQVLAPSQHPVIDMDTSEQQLSDSIVCPLGRQLDLQENIARPGTQIIYLYVDDIYGIGDGVKLSIQAFGWSLSRLGESDRGRMVGLLFNLSCRPGYLSQIEYIRKQMSLLADETGLSKRVTNLPWPLKFTGSTAEPLLDCLGQSQFLSIIMKLNWIAMKTRFDLSLTVTRLAHFNGRATSTLLRLAKNALAYVLSTAYYAVPIVPVAPRDCALYAFSDASWASKADEYRSIGGSILLLADKKYIKHIDTPLTRLGLLENCTVVCWRSAVLPNICKSTATAELLAFCRTAESAALYEII
jgi:hypothetical protein